MIGISNTPSSINNSHFNLNWLALVFTSVILIHDVWTWLSDQKTNKKKLQHTSMKTTSYLAIVSIHQLLGKFLVHSSIAL